MSDTPRSDAWMADGNDCPQFYAEVRDLWNRREVHAIDNSRPMTAKEIREEISNSPEHRFVPGVPRATGEYEQRPGDDLVKNLRDALLDTAPNRPLGGDLFCWCAMPWRAGLRQHQHSPTCQKVRGIVYRPDVLAYHDELDQSHAQGGTTERPFAHDPANPGINKGNEGPRF